MTGTWKQFLLSTGLTSDSPLVGRLLDASTMTTGPRQHQHVYLGTAVIRAVSKAMLSQ